MPELRLGLELGKLWNVAHLKLFHGNNGKIVRSSQCFICKKGDYQVEKNSSPTRPRSYFIVTQDAKLKLGMISPDMATVLHFEPDLSLLTIDHSRRSQILWKRY